MKSPHDAAHLQEAQALIGKAAALLRVVTATEGTQKAQEHLAEAVLWVNARLVVIKRDR